ncbi:MAG: hypothetical protein ACYDEY_16245 [Acidimicrobiales bacterium]
MHEVLVEIPTFETRHAVLKMMQMMMEHPHAAGVYLRQAGLDTRASARRHAGLIDLSEASQPPLGAPISPTPQCTRRSPRSVLAPDQVVLPRPDNVQTRFALAQQAISVLATPPHGAPTATAMRFRMLDNCSAVIREGVWLILQLRNTQSPRLFSGGIPRLTAELPAPNAPTVTLVCLMVNFRA